MTCTYGGIPCLDPAQELANCQALGYPTPWAGAANSFTCPQGQDYGRGRVLMLRGDLLSLNLNTFYPLVFSDGTRSVTLKQVLFVRACCATPGGRGDPTEAYWVELADKRYLCHQPIDRGYNLRSTPGGAYYSATLTGGVAWTWSQMAADIWGVVGKLGTFPGLPFTPNGTPDGWAFWGSDAFDALGRVLDRLGCALDYNPIADTFNIVRLGVADAVEVSALNTVDPACVWDSDPLEGVRVRVPASLIIFFPKQRLTSDTTGGSWYYSITQTDPTPGGPLPGTDPGNVAFLHDDMPATYDNTGTLTNAVDLATRAAERAADYYRRIRQTRLHRAYTGGYGLLGLLPGSQLTAITWRDLGGGLFTEVARWPAAAGDFVSPGMPEAGAKGDTGVAGATGAAGAAGVSLSVSVPPAAASGGNCHCPGTGAPGTHTPPGPGSAVPPGAAPAPPPPLPTWLNETIRNYTFPTLTITDQTNPGLQIGPGPGGQGLTAIPKGAITPAGGSPVAGLKIPVGFPVYVGDSGNPLLSIGKGVQGGFPGVVLQAVIGVTPPGGSVGPGVMFTPDIPLGFGDSTGNDPALKLDAGTQGGGTVSFLQAAKGFAGAAGMILGANFPMFWGSSGKAGLQMTATTTDDGISGIKLQDSATPGVTVGPDLNAVGKLNVTGDTTLGNLTVTGTTTGVGGGTTTHFTGTTPDPQAFATVFDKTSTSGLIGAVALKNTNTTGHALNWRITFKDMFGTTGSSAATSLSSGALIGWNLTGSIGVSGAVAPFQEFKLEVEESSAGAPATYEVYLTLAN